MLKSILRLIALYIGFGLVWALLGIGLLPDSPGDTIAFLYAFGGGAIVIVGIPLLAFQIGWLD